MISSSGASSSRVRNRSNPEVHSILTLDYNPKVIQPASHILRRASVAGEWDPEWFVGTDATQNFRGLVFQVRVAGGTTVADIARVVGVSRATLYRHLKVGA
ncbi:MAG: helix-turn-helix domain-containing protein [Dermatophilaceae bacterium]